ncbi:MAG: RDD family protein [Helicobacteraceae bacterium]|jgi:uncharacterized RDD family membrane protein YckC|nr:RDD family protein [Helicobacteraceae bacterium]
MNEDKLDRDLAREELRTASDRRRVMAFIIDETIVSFVALIAMWDALSKTDDVLVQIDIILANSLWITAFSVVYQTIFIALYGATLGKISQRILVIETDTFEKPGLFSALGRALMRVVSSSCFWLGFLWAFNSYYRQTWHDKIARTIVIDA